MTQSSSTKSLRQRLVPRSEVNELGLTVSLVKAGKVLEGPDAGQWHLISPRRSRRAVRTNNIHFPPSLCLPPHPSPLLFLLLALSTSRLPRDNKQFLESRPERSFPVHP